MKIKSQHQILMRFTWIEVVDTQRQRGRRGRRVGSKRKMNMEEMYEVLRFIEHGTQCRQSMDCVEGTILIYYLRDHPMVEKRILFEWFRQIGTSLDQFHRCRKGQCYRYLNPYSVVVTGEGVLLLMNLEAPENEFVMKKMQQRAVRVHFLRPAAARRAGQMRAADLFGFGRTMQFMLACTEVVPGLTHWEKARLTRIIGRCTESGRKQYEEIRQAVRELPEVRKRLIPGKRLWMAGIGAAVLLAAGGGMYAVMKEENPEGPGEMQQTQKAETQTEHISDAVQISEDRAEEYMEEAAGMLATFLLENTEEGNRQVIQKGRELEVQALRCLAAAYEREEMTEEAIQACGRLVEIEEQQERIESAGVKKMQLEAGQGQYAKAVLTGETVLRKLGASQQIEQLMEEYRQKNDGEEQRDDQEN